MNKEGSRVICNPVPTSFQAHRVIYDSRPFLVHLVFADLSSLHPSSFHEMIFTLVIIMCPHPYTLFPVFCQNKDPSGVQKGQVRAQTVPSFLLFYQPLCILVIVEMNLFLAPRCTKNACVCMYILYYNAQTATLLSKHRDEKQWCIFRDSAGCL